MTDRLPLARTALAATLCLLLALAARAEDLRLGFSQPAFDPGRETVDVTLEAPAAGQAIVRFYGPDWRPVAELEFPTIEARRPVSLPWDGRSAEGAVLPDEAYFATVDFAAAADGAAMTLDRSVEKALGEVLVQDIVHDAGAGEIRFRLSVPARVTLLAGIDDGGPLMATLLSGVPFPPGTHSLAWDGMDQSGVIDVAGHERFRLFASAREVVAPAIIVTGGEGEPYFQFTRQLAEEEIPVKEGIDMATFGGAAHLLPSPADISPEPVFTLSVPGAVPGPDGIPVVSGAVPLRVALGDDVRVPVLARRFEIVLFQNLEFTTEIEEGRSPATIVWDASAMPSGRYLLTVNVATLPGQMSAASTYVDLQQ